MTSPLDWILHLDKHLDALILSMGTRTYLILFAVLFFETGLVVTPFLPGDSLIFVTGALIARHAALNPWLVYLVFVLGAIIGDSVNFEIGKHLGTRAFRSEKARFLNPQNLKRTEDFFRKYGGKTIVLARFVPFVRTFAPFVAGAGKMHYPHFLVYNVVGAFAWVALFEVGGYFFGNLPFVKTHFELVVLAVIALSLVPVGVEYLRARREKAENEPVYASPGTKPSDAS